MTDYTAAEGQLFIHVANVTQSGKWRKMLTWVLNKNTEIFYVTEAVHKKNDVYYEEKKIIWHKYYVDRRTDGRIDR